MNVARTLVSLYPRPFKERWGAALEGDARAAGWRCWPNALVLPELPRPHLGVPLGRSVQQRLGGAAHDMVEERDHVVCLDR
jgi:hypothetical protein